MTPIGHAAAGYVMTYAALEILKPPLPELQINWLIFFGIFWAVIVDWDQVLSLIVSKSLRLNADNISHRRFASHAPLLWLLFGAIVYLLSTSAYGYYFAFIVLLGSMGHFIFDSIEYGIMWLWPFSKKPYSLLPGPTIDFPQGNSLIAFYWNMTEAYMKTITFRFEAAFIVSALLLSVFIFTNTA